jgi:hypothetical protein
MIRFLICAVLLSFCSCFSYTIPALMPDVSPDLISESGLITQKADSLNITFGHLETTTQFWIFSVTVNNRSRNPILVNPDMFYYKTLNTEARTISIPHFAHSRDYLLNHAKIELGKAAARLSYKELTPRLVASFDSYLLKTTFATDTLPLEGIVYFPKQPNAKNLIFNFKIDSLDFETPFVMKQKSLIYVAED